MTYISASALLPPPVRVAAAAAACATTGRWRKKLSSLRRRLLYVQCGFYSGYYVVSSVSLSPFTFPSPSEGGNVRRGNRKKKKKTMIKMCEGARQSKAAISQREIAEWNKDF